MKVSGAYVFTERSTGFKCVGSSINMSERVLGYLKPSRTLDSVVSRKLHKAVKEGTLAD